MGDRWRTSGWRARRTAMRERARYRAVPHDAPPPILSDATRRCGTCCSLQPAPRVLVEHVNGCHRSTLCCMGRPPPRRHRDCAACRRGVGALPRARVSRGALRARRSNTAVLRALVQAAFAEERLVPRSRTRRLQDARRAAPQRRRRRRVVARRRCSERPGGPRHGGSHATPRGYCSVDALSSAATSVSIVVFLASVARTVFPSRWRPSRRPTPCMLLPSAPAVSLRRGCYLRTTVALSSTPRRRRQQASTLSRLAPTWHSGFTPARSYSNDAT